jgi:hypothetical protein
MDSTVPLVATAWLLAKLSMAMELLTSGAPISTVNITSPLV